MNVNDGCVLLFLPTDAVVWHIRWILFNQQEQMESCTRW